MLGGAGSEGRRLLVVGGSGVCRLTNISGEGGIREVVWCVGCCGLCRGVGLPGLVVVWCKGGHLLPVGWVDADIGLGAGLLVIGGGVVGGVGGSGCGGGCCGSGGGVGGCSGGGSGCCCGSGGCGVDGGVSGQLLLIGHLLQLDLWLRPKGDALLYGYVRVEVVAWGFVLCLGWRGQLDGLVRWLIGGSGGGGVDYGLGLVGLVGLRFIGGHVGGGGVSGGGGVVLWVLIGAILVGGGCCGSGCCCGSGGVGGCCCSVGGGSSCSVGCGGCGVGGGGVVGGS